MTARVTESVQFHAICYGFPTRSDDDRQAAMLVRDDGQDPRGNGPDHWRLAGADWNLGDGFRTWEEAYEFCKRFQNCLDTISGYEWQGISPGSFEIILRTTVVTYEHVDESYIPEFT